MTDDWFEFIEALSRAGARFLVVGAHALAVHGVSRGTQGLDVWFDPDPGNAARVWAALEEHTIRDLPLPFIGRRTLVANKRAAGRLKDLADLEALGE